MDADPQLQNNRSNFLQIPTGNTGNFDDSMNISPSNYGQYSQTRNATGSNVSFNGSTSTLSQPVAPAELLRAVVINRPTAQMIEAFRFSKPRVEMTEQEVIDFVMNPVPQGQKVL
ncbi:6817_t:CDS:2, partial [Dentiscutata heterogama]